MTYPSFRIALLAPVVLMAATLPMGSSLHADEIIRASATVYVEAYSQNRILRPGRSHGADLDEAVAFASDLSEFPLDVTASSIIGCSYAGVQTRAQVDVKTGHYISTSGGYRMMEVDIQSHTMIFPYARYLDRGTVTVSATVEFSRTISGIWSMSFDSGSDMAPHGNFEDGEYRVAENTKVRIVAEKWVSWGSFGVAGMWVEQDVFESDEIPAATVSLDLPTGRYRYTFELERSDTAYEGDSIQQIWDGIHMRCRLD